jgi:IS30 family transposase
MQPIYDFLQALEPIAVNFTDYWMNRLQDNPDPSLNLYSVIQRYRNYRRDKASDVKREVSFATFKGHDSAKPEPESTSSPERPRKCVCGKEHYFSECPYVVESIRTKNWKPDPAIEEKFEMKMKIPKLRGAILKAQQQAGSSQGNQNSSGSQKATFAAIKSSYSTIRERYPLQNSFILDSASNTHVCNDRSRLLDFTSAEECDELLVGDTATKIEGYGTVVLYAQPVTGDRPAELTLKDVAYAPGFHTNLVSFKRAKRGGIFWDTKLDILKTGGIPLCKLVDRFDQWVVEYNPVGTSSFATTKKSKTPLEIEASAETWHRRLGHLNLEAIERLPEAADGVNVTQEKPRSATCETCKLSKSKRQISRRPVLRATKPFERVHFDLIQMTTAYNGDNWILHLLDDATRMNFIYSFPEKSDVVDCVIAFSNMVKTQFNAIIKIFKFDNEQTLGNRFHKFVKEKGILLEQSVTYTPEQNGPAERSGGVIIMRSRALNIEARLPEDLWPESARTAVHLINRSPSRQLNWRSPYETLYQPLGQNVKRPNLANVRIFGCRAYVRIPNIPRKQKMAPRALVGYLVGYKASNIWRIWRPKKQDVIEVRDVEFDESRLYGPSEPSVVDRLKIVETPKELIEMPELNVGDIEQPHQIDGIEEPAERLPESTDQDSGQALQESMEQTRKELEDSTALLTPDATPDPRNQQEPQERQLQTELELSVSTGAESLEAIPEVSEPRPVRQIGLDLDEANIVEGPRTRKPSSRRREAYLTQLEKPEIMTGYLTAFAVALNQPKPLSQESLPPPPKNWREMLNHPHRDGFMKAAQVEYRELETRGTFKAVLRPRNVEVIPVIWVFTYKFDTDGYLTKYKARLCVRGDLQQLTLQDTYAATLAARVFRTLMAIAAAFDLESEQWDAINAFINSLLDETVYIEFPDGFQQEGMVLLVLRALYGLRRAPRLWQQEFSRALIKLGLKQIPEEPCLFTNDYAVILFFVDDIVALYRKEHRHRIMELKEAILRQYRMRDLGEISWFLGIRVIRDRKAQKLWLCQDSYIGKIAHRYHLEDRRPPCTPMGVEPLIRNEEKATPQQIHLYQQKIGSLLYATTITRSDVARTANKLSEYLLNPSQKHLDAADRAISYSYGTRYLAIEYSRQEEPEVFMCASDAAYGDNEDRKSTEGYLCKLFGGPIDWKASKQKTVTTSTTEAELLALSEAGKQTFWWKRLFNAIGLDLGHDMSIQCDNSQTVDLLVKEESPFRTKLRHIDIHHHWLRQEVQAQRIKINWIPTSRMAADGLTKILPRQKHEFFVKMLGLVDISDMISF